MLASRARFAGATLLRRSSTSSTSHRFGSTLVVADHDSGKLSDATLHVVSAASQLGDVSVLVAGADCADVAAQAASVSGVANVLVANDAAYAHGIAENMTNLVLACQEANNYSHILAAATNYGKNFIPRVAVKLDVAPLSEVTAVKSDSSFERPTYAGNAMCTVTSSDSVKVMTVRTTGFDKAPADGGSAAVADAPSPTAPDAGLSSFVSEEKVVSDRPDLSSARVVVSGGRGMKNGDNFGMLYELADKMGGAVGASRAAVDAEFVSNDLQIGQTGKVVAPELYIAVGISGAIQHLAGMKDSKVIACINKDPEAPIFQVSDVGLEADLFKAVPEMIEKL